MFGKSSGAFFLNVFHNMIVSDTQSSTLVMCKTYFIDNYNDHFWAWRVFGPRFQIPPSVTSQCDSYKLKDLNLDVLAKESLIDIRNKLEGSVALADDELSKLESIFDLFKTPCGKGVFRWQSDFRF